jgi:hypothetical protein
VDRPAASTRLNSRVIGDIIFSFQFMYCLRPLLFLEKGRSVQFLLQRPACWIPNPRGKPAKNAPLR